MLVATPVVGFVTLMINTIRSFGQPAVVCPVVLSVFGAAMTGTEVSLVGGAAMLTVSDPWDFVTDHGAHHPISIADVYTSGDGAETELVLGKLVTQSCGTTRHTSSSFWAHGTGVGCSRSWRGAVRSLATSSARQPMPRPVVPRGTGGPGAEA